MLIRFNSSLIAAIDWYETAPNTAHKDKEGETWKSDALKQLKALILKTPFVPTVEMQNGIAFEEFLYKFAAENKRGKDESVNKILKCIEGGKYQQWVRPLRLDIKYLDMNFTVVLSGKIDVLLKDKIIDIKTTNSYKAEKYLNSQQHIIYCIAACITQFEYHVIEWDTFPKIKSYNIARFTTNNDELEDLYLPALKDKIIRCLTVIDKLGYLKEFLRNYFCV